MKQWIFRISLVVTLAAFAVTPLPLSATSLNFKAGLFEPAMKSDLWETNLLNLDFEKKDMRHLYFAVEDEHGINQYASFFIEGGYSKKKLLSTYRDYEYADGSPVEQNLSLQIMSVEAGIKIHSNRYETFSVFVGGGAGLYYWIYRQWGDFIDFSTGAVDTDLEFEASAYTLGYMACGGLVIRLDREWGIMMEAKYRGVKGPPGDAFEGFEDIDLGGMIFSVGIQGFLK